MQVNCPKCHTLHALNEPEQGSTFYCKSCESRLVFNNHVSARHSTSVRKKMEPGLVERASLTTKRRGSVPGKALAGLGVLALLGFGGVGIAAFLLMTNRPAAPTSDQVAGSPDQPPTTTPIRKPEPFDPPQLLFSSNRDGTAQLYIANRNGDNIRNLTNHPSQNLSACWSPDGQKIVFTSTRDGGRRQLFLMDADGHDLVQLTSGRDESRCPAWSPDGKRIAFTRQFHDEHAEIYVMDADGKNQKSLTAGARFSADAAWSPDGKKLAFASNRDPGGFRLYFMDADGGNVKRLTKEGNVIGSVYPAWSPDGSSIVYSDKGSDGGIELFVTEPEATYHRQLTKRKGMCTFATWSPDGKELAFYSGTADENELLAIDPGSDTPMGLLQLATPRVPAQLVYSDGRVAWRPHTNVGETRVAEAERRFVEGEQRSGNERVEAFRQAYRAYRLALPSYTDKEKTRIQGQMVKAAAVVEADDARNNRFSLYAGAWYYTRDTVKSHYLIQEDGQVTILASTDERTSWKGQAIRKDGAVLIAWKNDGSYEKPELRGYVMDLKRYTTADDLDRATAAAQALYLGAAAPKETLPGARPATPVGASKRFVSEEGRFAADFPGKPESSVRPGPAPGLTQGTVAYTDENGVLFEMKWDDYRESPRRRVPLSAMIKKLYTQNAASHKDISLGADYQGIEISAAMTHTGEARNVRKRVYVVRSRVYQLSVLSARNVTLSEDVSTTFLDSFRLTEEDTSPPAPGR